MSQLDDGDATTRHLMLLPSLACQARCSYCFGPNRGPVMRDDIFDAALDWIAATTPPDKSLELTFHGGEPLLAGHAWYHRNLPRLRRCFGDRIRLGIQSNLWLLDNEYCELFRQYRVSLGTSLDGPEAINDTQRGAGCFARTTAGIETARRCGLCVGVICTFTRRSAASYQEVFEFFAAQGLNFSVHAATCGLDGAATDGLALGPQEKADLFIALFDQYQANVTRLQIPTFDSMARSISAGRGGLCTFTDCLGGYLTLAPDGGIFPCNRFSHHPEWRLGWIQEQPTLDDLSCTPVWHTLRQRELDVHKDCGDCVHFPYCRGGCAANAFAAQPPANQCGKRRLDRRDPYCQAYRRVFSHISDRALVEVFSEENLTVVVNYGANNHGMLQRGSLLQIMRGGPHPQRMAARAREVVACVALAASASPEEALAKLDVAGAITDRSRALASLTALHERLRKPPQELLNAYVHVTYACNLACTHCYAFSGPRRIGPTMAVADVIRLMRGAAEAGFGKAVITGGEPLMHVERDVLLDTLAEQRPAVKPMQVVLRTNLTMPLSGSLLARLTRAADVIVVSVDGDEVTHNARRGPGTYARAVASLRQLSAFLRESSGNLCRLELSATLSAPETAGTPGDSVRGLGRELGVLVRFKPVLPLGRAAKQGAALEYHSSLDDDAEEVACAPIPRATCGLGMNLYLGPDGACFPCYALTGHRHHLGNVLSDGMSYVLQQNAAYLGFTVDSNCLCRRCIVRYLCGGLCRVWDADDDLDAARGDCAALLAAQRKRLLTALDTLDIGLARWLSAGLLVPAALPEICGSA